MEAFNRECSGSSFSKVKELSGCIDLLGTKPLFALSGLPELPGTAPNLESLTSKHAWPLVNSR